MNRMILDENIRDDLRLQILLRIENNIDTTEKYDEENEEWCTDNDVSPIISNYIKEVDSIKIIIKGISFTKLEAILIHSFSDFGSGYINRELASPKPNLNLHQKIIIDVFDKVLKKIERSEKDYVYRMDKYAESFIEEALKFLASNIDKIINIPWFISTTEYDKPWCTIVWKIAIKDKIKTKARCFHQLIDDFRDEVEVRFERNAKFRIINIETINNHHFVEMEELYTEGCDIKMDYTKYNK